MPSCLAEKKEHMPTYDYKCPSCGNVFEKFHGMNEKLQVQCPACSTVAEKQIGMGAAIQFKGNGFYVNDYKASGASETEKTSSGSCPGGSCSCGV